MADSRRVPATILLVSAKHLIHAATVTVTADADRVLNTWALFIAFGESRALVVVALLIAAMLPAWMLFNRLGVWAAALFMLPQQILLLISCAGVFTVIANGRVPAGGVYSAAFLLQAQLPLFTLTAIHTWVMVSFLRKMR